MEITLTSIADIVKGEISGDGNQKIRGAEIGRAHV